MRWLCVAHEKEIPGFQDFTKVGFTPYSLGVGQFESLATFAKLITVQRPEAVVLAGTCGTIDANHVFKIFSCQHFAFPKIAREDLPEFMARAFASEPAVTAVKLPQATVLQNHGVSLDQEKFVLNSGYIPPGFPLPVLENMEAASLAFLCTKEKIPFTAILCVTNAIGPNARGEWKQNFKEAGSRLAKQLLSL